MEHWLTANRLCGVDRIFCTHSRSRLKSVSVPCFLQGGSLAIRITSRGKMAYPAAASSGSQPTAMRRTANEGAGQRWLFLCEETDIGEWFRNETGKEMPHWWPPSWFCQVVFSKWPTANLIARLGNGPQPTMGFIFDCISGLPLSLVLCGAGVPGDSGSLESVAQQVGVWCVCVTCVCWSMWHMKWEGKLPGPPLWRCHPMPPPSSVPGRALVHSFPPVCVCRCRCVYVRTYVCVWSGNWVPSKVCVCVSVGVCVGVCV